MSKFSQKAVAVGLAIATTAWLAGAILPASAQTSATTIATLMAQLQAIQAQIAALQGGSSNSSTAVSSAYNYTRDLTVGSKGADVSALQQMLISGGYLKISAPTDYFGPLTKAALAAYQKAMGITPASGYFGPKTRAYVAAHASSTGTGTGTGTGVLTPVSVPMSVSLASDSPMATNVAAGAINTPVTKLNFTAGATPVTVTQLILTRTGLSQDSDLNNVYLYQGATRLATNLGFNNGRITFSNGAGLFTVPANSTLEITVSADVNSSAGTGHIFQIGLNAASDVTAGGATFTGSFPVNGAAMTVASVSNLATLTLSGAASSSVNVNAGQTNYLVAQFNLMASNNPVKVTSLRFTNVGSVDPSYLQNVKLMYGSTQLGATINNLPSSNIALFDLSSAPLMLTSGQTVVLSLYADIMGGVNRTFQFSVQQSSDIQAVDTMYGVGIGASSTVGSGFPVNFYNAQINNGGVVLSKDANTPTNAVVAGNTNQLLAKFDVLASGDSVKFNQIDFGIAGSNALANFRIVDDQGTQIGTTAASVTGTSTMNIAYSAGSGNLNYIIPANTTRVLSVYGDLGSSASGAVQIGIQGFSAQSYTTYASIGPASVSGNSLQVLASSTNLSVSQNYGLGSPVQAPAGLGNVKIGSYTFTAGQVNPVNLTGISLLIANNATTAGYLRNVRMMYGTQQVGNVQSTVSANTTYTFNTGAPISIAANGSVTLDVFADISSSITATTTVAMTTVSAINASTASGNAVALGASVPGQNVSFNNGGTMTVSADPSSPQSAYVGMGVQGVTLAKFRFTTDSNGGSALTQLTVTDASSTATTTNPASDQSSLVNYRLVASDGTTLSTASENSSGVITFNVNSTNPSVNVPVANYGTVSLVADVGTYPSATTGGKHAYWVTGYQYTNAAGSNTSTSTAVGNLFTVYRTTLGVTAGTFSAPASISTAGGTVGAFNFAVGSGSDALIKTITLSTGGSFIQASTTQVLGIYDLSLQSAPLATSTATSTNNFVFTLTGMTNGGWDISANTASKALTVKTVSGSNYNLPTNGGTGSYQVLLQGVTWADGITGTTSSIASLSPDISTPIYGTTVTASN
jgi:hypothetical protein